MKDRALTAMAGRPLLSGPLALTVTAVWPWPASLSSKKRALPGAEWRTSRPDWDNTGKLVSDSLNLIVWNDDAQVVQATVLKRYGESPGLTVEVRALAPV